MVLFATGVMEAGVACAAAAGAGVGVATGIGRWSGTGDGRVAAGVTAAGTTVTLSAHPINELLVKTSNFYLN